MHSIVITTENILFTVESNAHAQPNENDEKLPKIVDGKFFTFCSKENNSIKATCVTCKQNVLGSATSTGNFLSHLKRKHPSRVEEYKTYLKNNETKNEKLKTNLIQSTLIEPYPEKVIEG